MKIHFRHLHAPLRPDIFGPNSVNAVRYDSLIGTKSPTKWDAQLTESNFQAGYFSVWGRRPLRKRFLSSEKLNGIRG